MWWHLASDCKLSVRFGAFWPLRASLHEIEGSFIHFSHLARGRSPKACDVDRLTESTKEVFQTREVAIANETVVVIEVAQHVMKAVKSNLKVSFTTT